MEPLTDTLFTHLILTKHFKVDIITVIITEILYMERGRFCNVFSSTSFVNCIYLFIFLGSKNFLLEFIIITIIIHCELQVPVFPFYLICRGDFNSLSQMDLFPFTLVPQLFLLYFTKIVATVIGYSTLNGII